MEKQETRVTWASKGRLFWKVLVVREGRVDALSHSSSLISAPLPPAPREIMFPWGTKKHPFVQALIAMPLCQVNEWQAGAAAGHSQCQAAKPAALGQPGPAGLGALPTSALHPPPPLGALHWDSGAEESVERREESLEGEKGVAPGRVSATLRSLFISPSPLFPLPLVFQTVSINKAINTQEVAVKEKHARNILLDVAWKTDPERG